MLRSLGSRIATVLVCALLAAGCSGGGDDRGPTIVSGNVRSVSATAKAHGLERLWQLVRAWWSAAAVAQVPGVTVAIENTNSTTSTDEQGFFRLEGDKFGPATIQFGAPSISARLPVTLPAGGELDLVNVDVVVDEVRVGETRIQFEGPITGVDCSANLLQVLSGGLVAFRVRLLTGTAITDEDGKPLRCVDLVSGTAEVAGTVGDNGDVTALTIRVNPVSSGTPTPEDVVEGSIGVLHCPTDLTVITSNGSVAVNLTGTTAIEDTDGSTIGCGDLIPGDGVRAKGTLGSFGLAATEVDRTGPAPTPTPGGTPTPHP